MWKLELNPQRCACCGVCMDVCHARAIAMHVYRAARVEGGTPVFRALNSPKNPERPLSPQMGFPYLADAKRCDGCGDCVKQCPATALELSTAP